LPTSEDFLCPRNWDRRSFRAAIETAVDATPKQAALPVVTNSIGMKLLLIPPGESLMGSPKSSTSYAVERPMHQVRITRAFCLGAFPVTQAEYERVMGVNPSCFTGDPNRPVDNVSWEDAREFLRRLSALPEEEVAGHVYGLPTEAQWEYACRVGSITPWCFGDDPDRLGEHAWFLDNSGHETHPVGRKAANPWGLYDMYGNLWEWCEDWFGATYYGESPGDDPAGPPSGTYRILRGGSWACPVWNTCSASRHWLLADSRVSHAGFRAARTA
jgi:formylglycine-generating enzyme required for sulfatase activity